MVHHLVAIILSADVEYISVHKYQIQLPLAIKDTVNLIMSWGEKYFKAHSFLYNVC